MKKLLLLMTALLLSACFANMRDNLINAVHNLDYQKVVYYVEAGDDINARDNNGFTPLILASYYGNAPIVKYLCDKGADLNIQDDDGWTALTYASYYQFEQVVRVLLMYNPDVDIVNKYGYSALSYAEQHGNKKIVEMLRDKGAKPLF